MWSIKLGYQGIVSSKQMNNTAAILKKEYAQLISNKIQQRLIQQTIDLQDKELGEEIIEIVILIIMNEETKCDFAR